ncbi:MAG: hypothetical protein U1F67_04820 [Rubrivivax sp.]
MEPTIRPAAETASAAQVPAAPQARTPDAPAASTEDAPRARTPDVHSYWLSSLELRRGVEVKAIGVRSVPTEALRELLRMREAWRHTPPPLPAPREPAQAPAPQSAFELDIAFEADGRVTLPGDLLPLAA